jgi:hypothetical protein
MRSCCGLPLDRLRGVSPSARTYAKAVVSSIAKILAARRFEWTSRAEDSGR